MSFLPRTFEDLHHDFPPDLQHISASSINMALRCEEQWRQVYVLKQRKPPSLAILAGRADHAAIELSMIQKIETHVDLPVKDVQDAFLETLEADVEEAGGLGELEGETDSYDETRRMGEQVVGLYHRNVSPTVQPTAVEQAIVVDVPDVPVQVIGRIDLIAAMPMTLALDTVDIEVTQGLEIIDRKRSKRAAYKAKPDWTLQAGIYQLAEPLPYRWHISVHTKTPQVQTELTMPLGSASIVERQLRDACLKLGFLYQRYGPDEPWPATGKQHDWACNYCGFRDDCWGWK